MFTPWYLEIVRVSDREKQQDILTLLQVVDSVTALGNTSGRDHFVVFECPDVRLKVALEKLIVDVDPAAVLTQAHSHLLQSGGELA